MRTGCSGRAAAGRIAYLSMLLAGALAISFAESVLFRLAPLPGFKPGLANIAVMAALFVSIGGAAAVSLSRIIIMFLFFGNTVSLIMSTAGAVLSLAVLSLLKATRMSHISWIGASVLSALANNAGQLLAAVVLTGSSAVLSYMPVLLLSTIICGTVSGIVMNHTAYIIQCSIAGLNK